MVQAAPQQPERPTPVAPDGFGRVAAGGPIAELQRQIEERLNAVDLDAQPSVDDGLSHRLSRIAGPTALAFAYVGVALWWF